MNRWDEGSWDTITIIIVEQWENSLYKANEEDAL